MAYHASSSEDRSQCHFDQQHGQQSPIALRVPARPLTEPPLGLSEALTPTDDQEREASTGAEDADTSPPTETVPFDLSTPASRSYVQALTGLYAIQQWFEHRRRGACCAASAALLILHLRNAVLLMKLFDKDADAFAYDELDRVAQEQGSLMDVRQFDEDLIWNLQCFLAVIGRKLTDVPWPEECIGKCFAQ